MAIVVSIRSYLLYLFIGISLLSVAQDKSFNFQHYGPEDGLSNNNVWAVKQSPNGLMYIATQNGIYSYDGYSFIKIKAKNLKTTYIRNVNFESNSLLIVNREEGIYTVDKSSSNASKNNDLNFENKVDELIISGDYAYSISDQIEVSAINIKTKEYFPDELKNYDNQAFCIFKSKEGRVYIGRSTGLYWFNGGQQEKVKELKNNPVFSISTDNEGRLAIGSANKIIILNSNYKIEKEYFPKFKAAKTLLVSGEKNINKLLIDKYNRFWFTTFPDNNLYVYENNNIYDIFELLNITPTLINHLSKDKNENIWVSTFNDGVYFIQNPFLNNFSFGNNKILTVNEVKLYKDLILTATNNGLYGFNYNDYSLKTLSNPDEVFGEPIYNLSSNKNKYYYSKSTGFSSSIGSVYSGKEQLTFKPISSKFILLLNNSEALIAESGTIYKINIANEKILDTLVSFPDYRIKISTMLIKDNKLYIGTSNGLTIADLNRNSIYNDTAFNFSINHISLINNRLFIAHEGGFSIYEEKKTISQLGEIKLTSVKKIKFNSNFIWIATLNGLYLCDVNLNPITEFNKSCGLLSNTINDIEFDGIKTCIATDRGISVAKTEDIIKFRYKPEKIQLLAYEIDQRSFYDVPEKIFLTAEQNNIALYFSSPVFNKPNKQYFKYTDETGKEIQLENKQIQINSIKGGKHLVKISASLDNINWSEPVTLEIIKEVSFEETGWLYVIFFTGALIIIIIISYFWVKQVKKKAKKRISDEQQINLLKHQAMNSLLSPHFIFNSLTSIQNYINTNNSLMASEYLAKFSRLIRMIIEKASQSRITLRDEVVRLNYYLDLEKERFKNKFDFVIQVADDINRDDISIPNMIIQPHAENSIIHGILPKHEHGTLKIKFAKCKTDLIITIEDDGIGLIKAKEHAKSSHKSLGTSTISNILELNSKLYNKKQSVKMEDKSVLNPNDHGTLITITLEL